jgi:imidazolonepropionase-like amidohydrolase
MRSLIVAMLAAASTLACDGKPALDTSGPSHATLIRNVMIASPERDAAYGPTSVRIADGRIAGIGETLDAHDGESVVDGTGLYLSPGLIDSHAHLGDIPGFSFDNERDHPQVAREARAQVPRSYLFHGFTTVIDLGAGTKRQVDAWNAHALRPQAHFCGAAPVLDGYPTHFVPAPLRYELAPDFLHDPSRDETLPPGADPADHTPEAVVARIADSGGICVKTYHEPGFGQDAGRLPMPSTALVQALVAAAHARGMPVFLHANSQDSQAFGIEAGVDAFAHGMWHWKDNRATEPSADLIAQLNRMIAAEIAMQPTVQVLYGEGELLDPAFLERPALADVYPSSLLAFYATPEAQGFRDTLAEHVYTGGWTPDSPIVLRVRNALREFASHDGRLLFGTDTPSAPTYANPPGLNGRWEMDRWVEAGISPRGIFRAATLGNAEFFGLEDGIGSIAPGKQADLLLLEADPFESVTAFDGIRTVFLDGRAVDRSELSAKP